MEQVIRIEQDGCLATCWKLEPRRRLCSLVFSKARGK